MPDAPNYFAKVIAAEHAVKSGELSPWPKAVIIGCPHCGRATKLCIPPFTFDAELRNMLLPPNTAARLACGAVVSLRRRIRHPFPLRAKRPQRPKCRPR